MKLRPVFKQKQGTYGSNLFDDYSIKLLRSVNSYSTIEYDHRILTEIDRDVRWYCEQAIRINVQMESSEVQGVIDMIVLFNDNTIVLREFKSKKDKDVIDSNPTLPISRSVEAKKLWAERYGQIFEVLTEKDIYLSPISLRNWKRILHYLAMGRRSNFVKYQDSILKQVTISGQCSLETIEKSHNLIDPQIIRMAVCNLLLKNRLLLIWMRLF